MRVNDAFVLVIPSRQGVYGVDEAGNTVLIEQFFDATEIDISRAYVGNTLGTLLPLETRVIDNNGDQMDDLALFYSVEDAEPLVESFMPTADGDLWVAVPLDPLGLHYESGNGIGYLVSDIFQLGEPVPLESGASSGVDEDRPEGMPEATVLHPVSPNPFNRLTTVRYSLKSDEYVRLAVYDARGALVRTLEDNLVGAGYHRIAWDASDKNGRPVAAGVYFVRFEAGDCRQNQKMMLLK
jgi:hypothetical protein